MTAASVNEARWFLVGYDTGVHVATVLCGTSSDGYDAGFEDGYRAGYEAHAAELAAQHAALWARVCPRLEAWPIAVRNHGVATERWAQRSAGVDWDAEAERARCIDSWREGTTP